jgi:Spy/CpxP family protein refolding chaperone
MIRKTILAAATFAAIGAAALIPTEASAGGGGKGGGHHGHWGHGYRGGGFGGIVVIGPSCWR